MLSANSIVVDHLDLKAMEEVDVFLFSSQSPMEGLLSNFCKIPSSTQM